MSFIKMRKAANKGLTETARHLGVTKQAVNAWERGAYEPSNDALRKMAEFYGCSVDDLLAVDDREAV